MIGLLTSVSGVTALLYGGWFCFRDPSLLRSAIKTGAIGALAVLASSHGAPVLLVCALALSAVGDLALSRSGERAFLIGLCSFALAHVAYIALFAGLGSGLPPLLPAIGLILYAIASEIWLAPHTGDMKWPVRVYVVLITLMGLAALTLPGGLNVALIGAGAFIASDTLLAVQLFRLDQASPLHRIISPALWVLYYGAQGLILWAVLG